MHIDLVIRYGNADLSSQNSSKDSNMKELPSFVDETRRNKEVLRVPSQYHLNSMVMDIANIQTLMSTPIKVTLTLAETLKVKPKLWHEVTLCLEKMGILVPELKPILMPK